MTTLSRPRRSTPLGHLVRTTGYSRMPLALMVVLLAIAAFRGPALFTSAGLGGAILSAAPLILAAMALTPIVMVGRGAVDLSIGPLIGFVNVTIIQWLVNNGINAPVKVIAWAIAAGVVWQVVMGTVIALLRIEPIIVALGGFLILAGLNLVIMPTPGGLAPEWLAAWGAGRSLFSPVLLVLVIAMLGWWLFTRTALYTHLRLTGSNERSAFVSGVPIGVMRVVAHAAAGVFAGLAGLCFTALIGSGDPNQGTTYTLLAVTALVLGGTSLAGGRGGVFGSVIAAIDIFLISYVLATFQLGSLASFVTQLMYGAVLVAALLISMLLARRAPRKTQEAAA